MANIKDTALDINAAPPSAEQLRMALLEEQMAEADKQEKLRARENQELTKFTESFLKDQVNENEIAMVRRLVMNAVKNGKYEALVYSFPSALCTDSGRAINSADPQWPETLQGKAKQLYERYQKNAKPQGYKLKAMVINFPGGMPGDIGFFLSWAPETK
ncbi:histidine kinase [Mesorhizobium onobrychidis]|uniref:Histidine kinase n=1 Tax=Mesorhizobium onobrychidis TaxID=2775404 RepID=A0ABY5R609_9HYPH|nr:histidine kinase [Mesorhizobium onobrychidis]UVC18279.1 histidine kinase [Mesorhizobium onobrychidis]